MSELGVLSRGMVLDEDRVVLLDGRTLLFVNVRTGELWTAGGEGGGPGEFAGSGGALGLYRGQDALTVWDLNNDYRLTTFSFTGDVLGTRRFDVSSVEFDHWVTVARLYGVFTDGSLAFIDGQYHTDQPSAADRLREYVAEVGEDGNKRTIVEFAGAESRDVLFRHSTLVAIGNDRVAVADTESPEVMILDRMRFDGDGRLWMRHYVMPGANTKTWTVWDWDGGSTTFSVGMPASESLLDVRGSLVLLRVRSELGVDRAVIRQLVFG